jgi:hypothetical protein
MNKLIISKLHLPIEGYNYNLRIVTSIDGGKNFYYCGIGTYAKDEADIERRKAELIEKYSPVEVIGQEVKND